MFYLRSGDISSSAARATKTPSQLRNHFKFASAFAGAMLTYGQCSNAADTPFTWTGSSNNGNFTTAGNWSPALVPNSSASAATIGKAGIYAVNLTQNDTVDTLTLNNAGLKFNQSAGTLTASSVNVSGGVYNLLGTAQLSTGVLSVSSASQFNVVSGGFNNLNLSNGTTVSLNQSNAILNVSNGLNSAGSATINLVGSGSEINFAGNQSVNGINLNLNNAFNGYFPNFYTEVNAANQLTIGPQSSITGAGILMGSSIVNQGNINASGGYISVEATTFTSSGTLTDNQGSLYFYSNLTNTGQIVINSGEGEFRSAFNNSGKISFSSSPESGVGSFNNSGSIAINNGSNLEFLGSFNNSGAISVDSTSELEFFALGTGTGSVTASAGSTILISVPSFNTSSLNGFSLQGANVTIEGSLNNSSAALNLDSNVLGNPTFNGFNISGGTVHLASGQSIISPGSMIIADTALDNGTRFVGVGVIGGPSLNNAGLIAADFSVTGVDNVYLYFSLTLNPASLTNTGTLASQHDCRLEIDTPSWTNSGNITVDSTSTATITGTLNNTGNIWVSGTLNITSGTLQNSGEITLAGGTLEVNGTLDVGEGSLTGSGTLVGDLQLDNDPSTLAIAVSNASSYTLIAVNGDAVLGGYLTIDLPDGVDPSLISSDVFDVLSDSGSMSGSFLNVASGGRLETADGIGSFEVDYGGSGAYANQVVLSNFETTTVPEPGSLVMISIATTGLLNRRRLRQS